MTVTAAARPTRTQHPGYTQTLPCSARSAVLARSLVRTALDTWGLDHLTDAAALIVTELVSNSVNHTHTRTIQVTVSRPGKLFVRVAVADDSKSIPTIRVQADHHEEAGRGLAIIEALTWRWGTDLLPAGKRVWGDIRSEVDR
ncbi:ATP-binding protein [Streptomyces niveus]